MPQERVSKSHEKIPTTIIRSCFVLCSDKFTLSPAFFLFATLLAATPAFADASGVHDVEKPRTFGWHTEYVVEDVIRNSDSIRLIRLERALDHGGFVSYEGKQACFAKGESSVQSGLVRFNSVGRFLVGDYLLVYDFEQAGTIINKQPHCDFEKPPNARSAEVLPEIRLGGYLVVHKYQSNYAAFIQSAWFSTRLNLELSQALELKGSTPLIAKTVNEYNANGLYVDLENLLQRSGWNDVVFDEFP